MAEPTPASCRHCGAADGHPGLEYCPDTGGRLPDRRRPSPPRPAATAAVAVVAVGETTEPVAPEAGRPEPSRDPHAAFDKAWMLEIAGRDPIGLDDGDSIVLGRDPASPIGGWCDDNISRRHLEVWVEGDVLLARDLGSTNGTFLNGERLDPTRSAPCADGDVLQLATDDPIRVDVRG